MKVFATSLLAAASAALEVQNIQSDHHQLNSHYDNQDAQHHYYGGDKPASPAYPLAPNFQEAVDKFDTYGTLFGEHRYQLQVAKTGNMLIGTEAIRSSIAALRDRVQHARAHVSQNDHDIDENDSDIEDNRLQITKNRERLYVLDGKIHDLESGYAELQHKLAVDREALIMMCHQYAYATTIPDECVPIIGGLSQPIPYQWSWPQVDCPGPNPLPPFPHPLPHYEKITTDDGDDLGHKNHHHHHHGHEYPQPHPVDHSHDQGGVYPGPPNPPAP